LRQPPAEVERAPDEKRLLVVTAKHVDARVFLPALDFDAVPGMEAKKVALGEDEVILFDVVHEIAASLAKPQRSPAILGRANPPPEAAGGAVEEGRLLGIAEDLVERGAFEAVARESPSNFGSEVERVELLVGVVDFDRLAALGNCAGLS